jgi:hypothetical protein
MRTQQLNGELVIIVRKENMFPVERLARIETLAPYSGMGLKTPYLADF